MLWTGVEVKLHFPLCLEANKFSIKKSSNMSSYLILNAKNIVIPCTSIFKRELIFKLIYLPIYSIAHFSLGQLLCLTLGFVVF